MAHTVTAMRRLLHSRCILSEVAPVKLDGPHGLRRSSWRLRDGSRAQALSRTACSTSRTITARTACRRRVVWDCHRRCHHRPLNHSPLAGALDLQLFLALTGEHAVAFSGSSTIVAHFGAHQAPAAFGCSARRFVCLEPTAMRFGRSNRVAWLGAIVARSALPGA